MKRRLIRTSLTLLMLVTGVCAGKQGLLKEDGQKHSQVSIHTHLKRAGVVFAYERARVSMLAEGEVYSDVLWGLTQLQKKDAELESFIDDAKKDVYQPFYIPGVFPTLPRVDLPEDPGEGINRFFNYVKVPFGKPEERAMSHLANFIAEECSGYILTHQFFCMVWAEQAGLPVTDEMFDRRQQLWKRIYDEQRRMEAVDSSDLYMERVAIVLMYGQKKKVDEKIVDQWIGTIIDMQLPDGSWPLSKTPIHYDGGTTMLSSPRSHTTVLAMMALDAYASFRTPP